MLTRRRMFSSIIGIATLGPTLLTTGCWLSTVYKEILKYIGVGLQAFQGALDLLMGAGVIPAGEGTAISIVINLVKSGFADLQTAVNEYEQAPAANKATLAQRISTIIGILENNIQNFWSSLTIPNPQLASTIEGLLSIILSTLAGFLPSLPAPSPQQRVAVRGKLTITPQKRSVKQFKQDINGVLTANGYKQVFN